jgi:hypothetical protein
VAERGPVVIRAGDMQSIQFDELSGVQGPRTKADASRITLTLRSGIVVNLDIRGRDGNFLERPGARRGPGCLQRKTRCIRRRQAVRQGWHSLRHRDNDMPRVLHRWMSNSSHLCRDTGCGQSAKRRPLPGNEDEAANRLAAGSELSLFRLVRGAASKNEPMTGRQRNDQQS